MKILVAVDGSAHALRAAKMAARIARSTGSSMTAVMVVEPPRAPLEYLEELRVEIRKMAEKTLRRVQEQARRDRVAVKAKVVEGHVPSEILKMAERGRFDLLVIGSRGLSGMGRLLLGSVSGAVVQRAKTSVLVVR
jgi:nucleotide-binding universal stress UspA family protein